MTGHWDIDGDWILYVGDDILRFPTVDELIGYCGDHKIGLMPCDSVISRCQPAEPEMPDS